MGGILERFVLLCGYGLPCIRAWGSPNRVENVNFTRGRSSLMPLVYGVFGFEAQLPCHTRTRNQARKGLQGVRARRRCQAVMLQSGVACEEVREYWGVAAAVLE